MILLQAIDFITFTLLFNDINSTILHRRGQAFQSNSSEVWQTAEATSLTADCLKESLKMVKDLRQLVFVVTLVKNYVSLQEPSSLLLGIMNL